MNEKEILKAASHFKLFLWRGKKKAFDFFICSRKIVLGGGNKSYGNRSSVLKMSWNSLKIGLTFSHTTDALWAFRLLKTIGSPSDLGVSGE